MEAADWIGLGTLIVTAMGLAAVFLEILQAKSVQEGEFARQKTIDTFEFYDNSRSRIRDNHQIVISALTKAFPDIPSEGTIPLCELQVSYLVSDGEENRAIRAKVVDSLALLERLAIGVNMGVFDEEVIFKLSRTQISGYLGYYSRYILYARSWTPAAYAEFEALASRFHKRSVLDGKKPSVAYEAAVELQLLPIREKK
ncbi:DUF4760 domain-containing protein [Loktanella sp. M215]|uniref:DUF4760 domain-containing protein n=1 Tax=Loktanella sp. M215 TaxID=2675431 RepID=UPI001F34785F|nr:DUF4760 domain-containing protein [Loktanella sp. M215]MCF7698029.1 DUF4760 domain-containing protein [Loktanella sp. M215]